MSDSEDESDISENEMSIEDHMRYALNILKPLYALNNDVDNGRPDRLASVLNLDPITILSNRADCELFSTYLESVSSNLAETCEELKDVCSNINNRGGSHNRKKTMYKKYRKKNKHTKRRYKKGKK